MENERFDKDVLLNTIVVRGAQFEPLYSNPEFFLQMSDSWWMAHRRTFEKWFDAFDIVYAPLENYDRHEEWTDDNTHSDDDSLSSKRNYRQNSTSNILERKIGEKKDRLKLKDPWGDFFE